jgi:hypothetical protein
MCLPRCCCNDVWRRVSICRSVQKHFIGQTSCRVHGIGRGGGERRCDSHTRTRDGVVATMCGGGSQFAGQCKGSVCVPR